MPAALMENEMSAIVINNEQFAALVRGETVTISSGDRDGGFGGPRACFSVELDVKLPDQFSVLDMINAICESIDPRTSMILSAIAIANNGMMHATLKQIWEAVRPDQPYEGASPETLIAAVQEAMTEVQYDAEAQSTGES